MPARKPSRPAPLFVAPMQKGDVTTRLVTALKGMIGEGGLAPGAKLPSERELALRFSVSRPSLRQALKVLEIMGVLSQRVGDGTYLSTNASAILSEPMEFLVLLDGISHLELFEARMIVEPELAARAAARATAEDISILKKVVGEMEGKPADHARQAELDIVFHDEIFRAAGNRVCRQMFSVIHRGILTSIARLAQRARLEAVIAEHKLIYDAISRREPDQARTRMIDHLQKARSLFLAVGN
ncbi:MAG: FadR family transcriptional regulator [Acidobacteriia bacterium]|nr:FadR family transcriptional regulator [Terriglobia bacterium]